MRCRKVGGNMKPYRRRSHVPKRPLRFGISSWLCSLQRLYEHTLPGLLDQLRMITKLFCLPNFRFPNLLVRFDRAAVDSTSAGVTSDLIAAMTLLTQFHLVSRDELTRNVSSYSIVQHKLNVTGVRQIDVHFWVASACLLWPVLAFSCCMAMSSF
jgi:hypothetical protein